MKSQIIIHIETDEKNVRVKMDTIVNKNSSDLHKIVVDSVYKRIDEIITAVTS